MRGTLSGIAWVALVLLGGPVLASDPAGVPIAAWTTAGVFVAGVGVAYWAPTTPHALVFTAVMTTALYWLVSAFYGPSLVWVAVWAVVCVPVGVWWALGRRGGERPARGNRWWSEPQMVEAFTTAGILRAPKDDAPPPRLVVKAAQDDYGTTVTVGLPPGVVFSTVEGKREALAAALSQPLHLVTVTQAKTDPANVATVRVTLPYERTIRPHNLPDVTCWRDPLTIGRDRRGRDITIPTWNTGQVLVGGQTSSGKTYFLRLLASHYALDPDASLFIVDGKGSTDDWGPIGHRCEDLVFVHDDRPGDRFFALLQTVQGIVTARNKAGGRDHPGCLVILEEFSSMLAMLETARKRDAARAVTRLTQTCRSANVLVVIAAQRPSASTMDTNTRAQAAVSVALSMKSPTDTTMVLGHTPTLELPDEPGEAIVVVPGKPDVLSDLDVLADEDWRVLCGSLPAVGRAWVPALIEDDPEPVEDDAVVQVGPAPVLHVVPVVEPVVSARDAVLAAMMEGGGTAKVGQLVAVTGKARSTVNVALKELVASGSVVSPVRGEYTLTE